MDKRKLIILTLSSILFLMGLATFLFPYWNGALVDHSIQQEATNFLVQVTKSTPSDPTYTVDPATPTETQPIQYPELLEDMIAYNESIYENGQEGLSSKFSYQQPSFILADYGLDSEVFGVISIPRLEIELPIYLGATYQHMNDGTAHLSQTSLPIGGSNTNCVIAGHRGWNGASYFLNITELEPGDEVTITNLWETLTYEVTGTEIIEPNDVGKILIQPGKDMLTLLTCHPYASGGRQRYLVICERIHYEPDTEIDHQ